MTQPHALYRFYNTDGVLVYIGITADIPARVRRHTADKPWWTEVARIALEPFPDRNTVLAAEKRAIQTELPLYNTVHNPDRPTRTRQLPPLRTALTCDSCGAVALSGKAVAHVFMPTVREVKRRRDEFFLEETARICQCGKRAWQVGDRHFHQDGTANLECWSVPSETHVVLTSAAEIMARPRRPRLAEWMVHCDDCNPHYSEDSGGWCDECYWYDIARIMTTEDCLRRTRHLQGKNWFQYTDWTTFLLRFTGELDV